MPSELEQKYINACLVGDIKLVEYMIKYEGKKVKNYSVLLECLRNACKGGHCDIVISLLNYKSIRNICQYNSTYDDILRDAFVGGNIDVIKCIITNNPKQWLCCGLYGACVVGRMDLFNKYIDEVINTAPSHFSAAYIWLGYLYKACECGNMLLFEYIVSKVSVGKIDWDKCLKLACRSGSIKLVEFAVEHGANKWEEGLDYACYSKNGGLQIAELMIAKGAKNWNECIFLACRLNNRQIVELFIEKGATNWDRGLMGACINGDTYLVDLMIKNGATNWNGGLMHACCGSKYGDGVNNKGNTDCAKLMIQKGATMTSKTIYQLTYDASLHTVCSQNNLTIIEMLVHNGFADWVDVLEAMCSKIYINTELNSIDWALRQGNYNIAQLNRCLKFNKVRKNGVDISIKLIVKGADDLDCLYDTNDFKLYCLYCRYKGKVDSNKYNILLREYPPYILLVGSKYRSKTNVCIIKRLPIDIFRLLVQF